MNAEAARLPVCLFLYLNYGVYMHNGDGFQQRMIDRFGITIDRDWTEREARLFILRLIYEGKLYDCLLPWHKEYEEGGVEGYIPLAKRRPSVIYNIPKIIVDESTSMLFGDSHFPIVRYKSDDDEKDQENTNFLTQLIKNSNLKVKMVSAAKKGALGSVCIIVKVLDTKFYIDVLSTQHLTPVFDYSSPGKLKKLTEKRKFIGESLCSYGYDIKEDDRKKYFYIVREWNASAEIYYLPYLCDDEEKENFSPKVDAARSETHDLGFVPAVWIKNTEDDDRIDGACVFFSIIDIGIEVDYQLSQLGRMLKYNSDPTLVIKDPSMLSDSQIVKGKTITLGQEGDAYMLEMTSSSTTAVIEYVRLLRELALESVRGNRANPDKLSAINSGKALQMLNAKLISLVEDMRLTYGENGLKRVLSMMMSIFNSGKYKIETEGY